MTKMFIGTDSQGAACVKITKGSINPATEPDENHSSFLYNSKWSADVKLAATDSTNYRSSNTYFPSGSTMSNYRKVIQTPSAGSAKANYIGVRNTFFGDDLPYDLPLFDIKVRRLSDGKYIEHNRLRTEGGDDKLGQEPGYYETSDRGISAWFEDRPDATSNTTDVIGALGKGLYYFGSVVNGPGSDEVEKEVVVWRLPGDNTAIRDGQAKAPVSGHRSVEITRSACRVAKPGYDVRNASPTQLALDSSARPLSAIGAADINLPAGVTRYDLGFNVTANMLADLFLYTDNEITFPMSRYGKSLVGEYWFSGSSIFIDNKQSASCRCRFIVFSNDRAPLSSGNNDVFRRFTSGGENVMQLLRPGAGDPPALRDIVLDSRWPSLRILAEGYRSIASQPKKTPPNSINDGQSFSISFDGAGMFPIVKYMTIHQHEDFGKCVKFPQTLITENYNGGTQYHQGNSNYCVLTSNRATFWTFNGNPKAELFNDNDGWHMDYVPDPIVGIRYYILGIPQ